MIRILLAFIAFLSSPISNSGTLTEGVIAGQIQQSIIDGKVEACGVVVAAMEKPSQTTGQINVINASFMLMGAGGGLIKGRAATVDSSKILKIPQPPPKITPKLTEFVWMKPEGLAATTPNGKIKLQKSEDPGYIIYGASFESIIGLVDAVLDKKTIQIGAKTKTGNYDQAIFGVVQISDQEAIQLRNCIGDMAEALASQLSSYEEKNTSPLP